MNRETPYPFQEDGARWLAGMRRAYLADQMGLGKTIQVLLAILMCVPRPRTVLVVCPASGVPHWQEYFRRWAIGGLVVRVISYSVAIRHNLGVVDLLIVDEAHYVKNVSAQRTKKVLSAAKRAGRVWLLSGTPMPNTPEELWAPVKALWPEHALGCTRKWQWVDMFCNTEDNGFGVSVKPGVKNPEHLRKVLSKFMLRRRHGDVALPELRVDLTWLPKPATFGQLIRQYKAENVNQDIYHTTLRRLLGEAKAPVIAEQIVEELEAHAYDSIVVLYHHHSVRDAFLDVFQAAGRTVTGFDGSIRGTERAERVRTFQDGKADIFLAQQTAAGEVITLTRSREIVLAEPDWVPSVNEQGIKRIHRIGQTHPCRARIFAVPDTVDGSVVGAIALKTQGQIDAGLN